MALTALALAAWLGAAFAAGPDANRGGAAASVGRYIVQFQPGHSAAGKLALRQAGAELKLELNRLNAIAVTLPAPAVSALSRNPHIEYIEVDPEREWLLQTEGWANAQIQANLLSDAAASNQKLCIMDTGLDIGHEDLAGAHVTGTGTSWTTDERGHGTYMASMVVAVNNGIGVRGALPNGQIRLHMVKLGDKFASSYAKAVGLCMDAGATIASLSAGGPNKSKTEQRAFDQAYAAGMLLFASTGNDGNSDYEYPAGYDSVISVGAVDRYQQHAYYSQFNDQVELVAPGSAVLGTAVMGSRTRAEISVAGNSDFDAIPLFQSAWGQANAALADCGDGSQICAASGRICLIQPTQAGDLSAMVQNCQLGGGLAAIFHNDAIDVSNFGLVEPGATVIPSISVSDHEAATLRAQAGALVAVSSVQSNYMRAFGTSASSPFAAAVAALVWSYHPSCSNVEIRNALAKGALDLGAPGRDPLYGHGLVQALASKAYLDNLPCGY